MGKRLEMSRIVVIFQYFEKVGIIKRVWRLLIYQEKN